MKMPGLNLLSRPIGYLSAEWDRMAPRERRLVAALMAVLMVLSGGLGVFLVTDSLSELSDHNAAVREALATIVKRRDDYLEARGRSAAQDARIGNEAPQLKADLEAAGRDTGVQIPEMNERPTAPAGRKYVQHEVDFRVRQVDLQSLTAFMQKVESGKRFIVLTRMSLKRRYGEQDKLDADMTAAAFERVNEDKAAKPKKDKP